MAIELNDTEEQGINAILGDDEDNGEIIDEGKSDLTDDAVLVDETAEGEQNDDESESATTESSTEEQAAPESSEAGSADDGDVFESEKFVLKFRGEDIKPKSREELIKYAQRGVLYDHKANELAQRQKELERRAAEVAQLEQLNSMIATNPDARELVEGLRSRVEEMGARSNINDPTGQIPTEFALQYQQMQQQLEMTKQQQEDELIKGQIEGLKGKYSDESWDIPNTQGKTLVVEILEHTLQNGFPSIEAAYKDLMWDRMRANAEAEALKKAGPAPQNPNVASVAGAGKKTATNGDIDLSKLSYDDLVSMAVSDLK